MHRRHNNGPRGQQPIVIEKTSDAGDGISFATIANSPDIESACEAFAVLLITPAGKYRRRIYLSLHSATAAVQRATDKGQPVRLVLCRLVPVAADLDTNGQVQS